MAFDPKEFKKPSVADLKKTLSPIQFSVTQQEDTEKPFQNEFHDSKDQGLYVDIVSGEPLFSSLDKFDSGCGWPSFSKPLKSVQLQEKSDEKLWQKRTEVRSKFADSHLGHVFNDGPQPSGLRYCINSAALRFIPLDELATQGYSEFLELFSKTEKRNKS